MSPEKRPPKSWSNLPKGPLAPATALDAAGNVFLVDRQTDKIKKYGLAETASG